MFESIDWWVAVRLASVRHPRRRRMLKKLKRKEEFPLTLHPTQTLQIITIIVKQRKELGRLNMLTDLLNARSPVDRCIAGYPGHLPVIPLCIGRGFLSAISHQLGTNTSK